MKTEGGEPAALDRLIELIREETGNTLPRGRQPYLEEIAQRRARSLGQRSLVDYVLALERGEIDGEWQRLVPLLTIKESFFFRAPQQFQVLERVLLPRLVSDRNRAPKLTLWSAATARGEEAGTLALVLAEYEPLAHWDWKVIATDLDVEALEGARRGLYGERAVAQVPPELLARWFERQGDLYELSPALRARIDYRPINLARPPYLELPEESFDLIFLRNVLIYFRRPLQRRVVGEAADRLAPGGTLFLGASETLWQISDRLAAIDLGDCFAYRHPPPQATAPPSPPRRGRAEGSAVAQVLGRPAPAPPSPPPLAPPPVDARGARAVLGSATAKPATASPLDARELVLRAARELAGNRLAEAAEILAQARAADGSEPAVHALLGFRADIAGRTEEATTAYRAALFLDPQLYQVRVLLAEALARLGHPERAEHQFRETLTTLAGGRAHELVLLDELPLPNRAGAERRCRVGLGGR